MKLKFQDRKAAQWDFNLPQVVEAKFEIVSQFFKIQPGGAGKMQKVEEKDFDPKNPDHRIFNVCKIDDNAKVLYPIEMGVLNAASGFEDICKHSDSVMEIAEDAIVSIQGKTMVFAISK